VKKATTRPKKVLILTMKLWKIKKKYWFWPWNNAKWYYLLEFGWKNVSTPAILGRTLYVILFMLQSPLSIGSPYTWGDTD
jgi:hypothetical protein